MKEGQTMNELIGKNIVMLRKELGLTQEQLANALGISYQAVSKWETGNACPDISMLPLLADLFSVSVDALIGRVPLMEARLQERKEMSTLPWPDDENFYAVLYAGHRLLRYLPAEPANEAEKQRFVFVYSGAVRDIHSDFSVTVDGPVEGDVVAGGNVRCDFVEGGVSANGDVSCGDVEGSVNAGGDLKCSDIDGNVSAGRDINCGDVDGSVNAGNNVYCGDVEGDVTAGSKVSCGDIGGDVNTGTRGHYDV